MARYEFSFVVTGVEKLPEDVRIRVGRAVALAGAAELGDVLPEDAVAAPVPGDEFLIRHWIGKPAELRLPNEA